MDIVAERKSRANLLTMHDKLTQFAHANGMLLGISGNVSGVMSLVFRDSMGSARTFTYDIVPNMITKWDKVYETIVKTVTEKFLSEIRGGE